MNLLLQIKNYLDESTPRKAPIIFIVFLCFFIRRGVFPQFINHYKLLYESSYWERSGDGWLNIAKSIVRGNGDFFEKKTAVRGPVYPLFLASILWLFGQENGLPIALTMQMVLDSITCLIIWKLAWKLFGCQYTALLSAFIWSFYAPAMIHDMMFYSEPLFTLILCFFVLHMLFIKDNLNRSNFFWGGFILGLSSLCRPVTLYFPLILLPALILYFRKQLKTILFGSLFFLFGFGLILSPWVIRNYHVFKLFIPSSTILGPLWYNNQIDGKDLYHDKFINRDINLSQRQGPFNDPDFLKKDEAERDQILRRAAWGLIKNDPYRYIIICLKRLKIIWLNLGNRRTSFLKKYLIVIFNLPLILLSLSTFIFFRNKVNVTFLIPLLLILYNTVGHMLVQASWRYNIPIIPYVIIFSAYSQIKILSRLRERRLLLKPAG